MLSLGALLTIREMNINAKIIQTNDWTTAYVKAYLEGRERIDLHARDLRHDGHLRHAKVISVMHHLHEHYQGRITAGDVYSRDDMIVHDLGLSLIRYLPL